MDHWRRGHKQMCKKIHRGGNAEQYHADKKYKEAVAEAVEACADDEMVSKYVRSYLSPESLAAWRQVCHDWLREIEDESRESRATVRAGPRDAGRPGPA